MSQVEEAARDVRDEHDIRLGHTKEGHYAHPVGADTPTLHQNACLSRLPFMTMLYYCTAVGAKPC